MNFLKSNISRDELFFNEKKMRKFIKKSSLYEKLLDKYNYQKVKGYPSLEQIITTVTTLTFGQERPFPSCYQPELILDDETIQYTLFMANDIYQKDIPLYWLDKDLLQLLLETDLPPIIGDLKIPFKEALILLPLNIFYSPENLPFNWFFFKHLDTNESWEEIEIENLMGKEPHKIKMEPVPNQKVIWVNSMKMVMYKGEQNLINGELHRKGLRIMSHFEPSEDNKKEELAFARIIDDLVIKMLLFLQIYPQIFEEMEGNSEQLLLKSSKLSIPQQVRKNKLKKRQPRWIKQLQKKLIHSNVKNGTKASPKAHFRRGHLRRVAVGFGRLERRWTWIEPTSAIRSV